MLRLTFTRQAPPPRLRLLTTLITAMVWATAARAAPTLGFVEDWAGTSLSGWTGGAVNSNPGTAGFNGAGDGFLMVSTSAVSNLGTKSNGAEYTGDWMVAGITQVWVSLNDVGTSQPLEIHFGIGRDLFNPNPNVWQYNVGFIPPSQAWGTFKVDLTSANWTQIHGTGSFANALQSVGTIHLRHDHAPFMSSPDPIQGDFGVDRLLLTNGVVGVEPRSRVVVGSPVQLAPPVPNPSRGVVALALETFESGPVHLQVVDASGRVVRHAELTDGAAGLRVWIWDGANDQGLQVAPAYYCVRAWSVSGGTSRALVRLE